jgi:hypothetical protein
MFWDNDVRASFLFLSVKKKKRKKERKKKVVANFPFLRDLMNGPDF